MERPKTHIPLLDDAGYIIRRKERAVLRYYLDYNNDEDFARGLLILFFPFREEMRDIHNHDVKDLYEDNKLSIQARRNIFEKHKVMTDIIYSLYKESDEAARNAEDELSDDDEFIEEETTSAEDIKSFENWIKEQAHKTLKQNKELTNLVDMKDLRDLIITLNNQQRMLFDDYCERLLLEENNSFHVYIAGEAGTGKSFLVKVMIEIIKHISMKSGDELEKPPAIVMAPTANAAYIINGKTVESALGIIPRNENAFSKANPGRICKFTFLYAAVIVVFCDEISMIGSSKFARINFQLQDITGCKEFMGGLSFVAVGDLRQLPPILDPYIYENNKRDERPAIAPSHWDENFKIFYLTEKIRSQKDADFSGIYDRVGNGTFDKNDEEYLKACVRDTDSENNNRNFKT